MGTYGERTKSGRVHTFGRNLHLARVNVAPIYSELTGKPVGKTIEKGDGSNDVVIIAPTVRTSAEELEQWVSLNTFRLRLYEKHRELGLTDEEARYRLFPNGKVKA